MIYQQDKKSMKVWIAKRAAAVAAATLPLLFMSPTPASAATVQASLKPAFQADLTNTLKLQTGVGNPTFTRATTAYVQDWEGLLKSALSGEARFTGARRVQNLISSSAVLFNDGRAVSSTLGGIPLYLATSPAFTDIYYSWSAVGGNSNLFSVTAGDTIVVSVYAKRGTASGLSSVSLINSGGSGLSNAVAVTIPASGGRVSATLTVTTTSASAQVRFQAVAGTTVEIGGLQVENVNGQSNQNPSEYVSCGVLAAPYHGAGADCVKYFNTLNGNTVASNVVGEASGAKITSSVSGASSATIDATGPLGYLAEGARTNLIIQSEDLATSWATGGAVGVSIGAAITAPNGTVTAKSLLGASGGTNFEMYEDFTKAASPVTYTVSAYAKPVGTGIDWLELQLQQPGLDGGAWVYFNTRTGVVGTGGSGGAEPFTVVAKSITPAPNGYYRVSATITTQSRTALRLDIVLASADNTNASGPNTTNGQTIWGVQLEAASFASSYTPTTSASVTRNADVLTYITSGNISGTVGTAYAEFTSAVPSGSQAVIIGGGSSGAGNTGAPLFVHTNDKTTTFDETNIASFATALSRPIATVTRAASYWGGSSSGGSSNGSSVTSGSFDGNISVSVIGVGHYVSSVLPPFGTIRNVKIWKKVLTNLQLTTMTSTNLATARAAVPQTTVKAPTGTGLVGYWKFDEGTGTRANDSSGLGRPGTFNGSPSWVGGKLGKALTFNGSSTYVRNTSNIITGNSARSISYWAKGSTADQIAVGLGTATGGTANAAFAFAPQSASSANIYGGTGPYDETGISISKNLLDNQWHHIVITWDALDPGTLKIYGDGVLIGTRVRGGGAAYNTQGGIIIGTWYDLNRYFSGSIDDVRLYSRALSAAEVAALYKSTAAVVNASTNTSGGSLTSGLVGLWSFDGKDVAWTSATAGTAIDRAGGHTGTFNNMTQSLSPVIGKMGQAMNFNGNIQYVTADLTSLGTLSQGTLSLWVKKTATGGILVEGNGSKPSFEGNPITFYVNNNCSTATTAMSTGVWFLLTGTWDGANARTYVNGTLSGGPTACTSAPTMGTFGIGARAGGSPASNGAIDDVRIYNRALSATEVKALYNLGR